MTRRGPTRVTAKIPQAADRPRPGPMSVIRQDPTTKEWVIVATSRARRPHDIPRGAARRPTRPHEPGCPFCPGNEAQAPGETLRLPEGDGAWAVRVVPNKFAALIPDGEPRRRERGPLFREMAGVGYHEVVIETPVHDRALPLMTTDEVGQVLRAYQRRHAALRQDPRVKYVIIFRNHGERAGTSLAHPHSQLVATPVAPVSLRRKYEVATAHYDDTGRCLYCDLVDAELEAKERVVLETEQFVVFHPFASRVPFETWIAPKRHEPSFARVSAEELTALADVLRRTVRALYDALGDPDFNYILHTAPVEDEGKNYYLWHVQVVPRLTTIAGFELGSRMAVTTMLPEESAAYIRDRMPAR